MNDDLSKESFVNNKNSANCISKDEEETEKIMDDVDLNSESSHQTEDSEDHSSRSVNVNDIIINTKKDVKSFLDIESPSKINHIEDTQSVDADNSSSNVSESSEISLSSFDSKILGMSKEELINVIKENCNERYLLEEENKSLQNEVDRCKADNSSSTYQANVEALEKDLAQAKADAFAWERDLETTKERMTKENIEIRVDLTARLERLTKQCEAANKNKESMVMKYAMAEKDVLVVKKQKENIEKKLKDVERDKEILQGKVKTLTTEKAKVCSTLDNKIQEYGFANRTIDKLRDEINAKDIKIKWGQTNLKSEMEAHKETQAKLDRALSKICNHEEEIQMTREEAEKIVKDTKDGENTRANILDKQLQETKALYIMERQKFDDTNSLYKQLKTEHEILRSSHFLLDTEVNTLRVKVHKYEQEREESEKLFKSLQSELKNLKQGKADLTEMLSHSAGFAEELEKKQNKLKSTEEEVKLTEMKLEEQTSELEKCKEKESELLIFTQKLTDKNVTLQSQLTACQGKVRLMDVEDREMRNQVKSLQTEVSKFSKELSQLKEAKKTKEAEFSSLLQEKIKENTQLETKVSDLLNEIQVLQKKHSNSLKDSNREIQKLRRKLDSLECRPSPSGTPPNTSEAHNGDVQNGESVSSWGKQESLSQESRASSDMSLHTVDSSHTNGSNTNYTSRDPANTAISPISDVPHQVLIDRIIRLQKNVMKKAEKCEFLEEHVAQLLNELKKKNKIIHYYIMKEDAGALVTSKSDDAKSPTSKLKRTQAEIMKHGGIMASVYGSSSKDCTMTLDLSLEINKKLQAVLEDTLLKNITLKDNLNTLGDEVAKLALQNSKLQ